MAKAIAAQVMTGDCFAALEVVEVHGFQLLWSLVEHVNRPYHRAVNNESEAFTCS